MKPENPAPLESGEEIIIPVVAERITLEKRLRETGGVRVHKTVHEREQVVDEPLLREAVTVERVAINRMVDGPAPAIRHEGETMIIPVVEEVLVVEKRWMLKEELHIRREQRVVHDPQTVTLRYEEANIERKEPQPT